MDVTLVTYSKYPDLAPDDRIFRDALMRRGARVRTAVWSDENVDWSRSAITVIRAVWDYPQRVDEFEAWLARVEGTTTLVNDVPTIRWNMHKHYLADLQRLGVRTAPTLFVRRGSTVDLAGTCSARGWSDVVIKPCIAGSSFGAARFADDSIASFGAEHLISLVRSGDAMVQPYLAEVERAGERAYVFIDGAFTHAVRKAPFNSATETTSERRLEPAAAELDFARRALGVVRERPIYARVDLIPTSDGPLLMELELIEPTLYFEFEPNAAVQLAAAVLRGGASSGAA